MTIRSQKYSHARSSTDQLTGNKTKYIRQYNGSSYAFLMLETPPHQRYTNHTEI